MRRAAWAVLFAATSASAAGVDTTEGLRDNCRAVELVASKPERADPGDKVGATVCLAYMNGVLGAEAVHGAVDRSRLFCADKANARQAAAAFMRESDDPSIWSMPSPVIVYNALMRAFPCPKP